MNIIALILTLFVLCLNANALELMKLNNYKDQDIKGWLVSEKLDGIRAYWDGKQLLSRTARVINAPKEFLDQLPKFALDGELWTKRGEFEFVQSIVMDSVANEEQWRHITYQIFDAPTQNGGLQERLKKVELYIQNNSPKQLAIVKQHTISSKDELDKLLDSLSKDGAEGLVIREPNMPYTGGRSNYNLKYKKFFDDECEVIGYVNGKGKLDGLMGAIKCKLRDGRVIKIGSGFSSEQRANPPKIGEMITYKFQGFTANNIPRFATFLRVRKD